MRGTFSRCILGLVLTGSLIFSACSGKPIGGTATIEVHNPEFPEPFNSELDISQKGDVEYSNYTRYMNLKNGETIGWHASNSADGTFYNITLEESQSDSITIGIPTLELKRDRPSVIIADMYIALSEHDIEVVHGDNSMAPILKIYHQGDALAPRTATNGPIAVIKLHVDAPAPAPTSRPWYDGKGM